jgi:hypothetical protein
VTFVPVLLSTYGQALLKEVNEMDGFFHALYEVVKSTHEKFGIFPEWLIAVLGVIALLGIVVKVVEFLRDL